MMTYPSNVVLASDEGHNEVDAPSLCLAGDMKTYSKTPKTVLRQLRAEGLPYCACLVYWAIADRQRYAAGEYFRSNKDLADEVQMSVASVKNGIRLLIDKGYLTRWFINGGRRMRVICKGQAVSPEGLITKPPRANDSPPYKDNNIKKTTQPKKVCVFSQKHLSLFGERVIENLVASYDSDRVMRGLQVFDQQKDGIVRNNVAWLTKAIKDDYEPSDKADRFPECPFSQTKIIDSYLAENPDKSVTIRDMIEKGLSEGRIAYKIWAGKI